MTIHSRAGCLRDVLQKAGITVIAEAGNGREAIELSVYYRPDVVVMDLVMPGMDGVAATRQIVDQAPDVRVVMLTSSDSEEVGMMTLRAGASGFLCKSVGVDALPRALRCARDGEAVVSRALTMRLIEGMRRVREDGSGMRPIRSPLTPREWEVLDLLCQESTTGRDRRRPRAVGRDRALPHQERPAQARRALASGGGSRPRPACARGSCSTTRPPRDSGVMARPIAAGIARREPSR
jgi:DNA-binding NarL/FixJ family response regulator